MYTNSPQNSTYKTVRIPFVSAPNFRNGNITNAFVTNPIRDVYIENMYWDRASNENKERWVGLKKRPGISTTALATNIGVGESITGYFYDEDSDYIYWAINGRVYNMNLSTNVTTLIQTMTNTSPFPNNSYVGFCSFLKASGVRYVIFTDGAELYYTVAGSLTATEVTDPDLPVPHQPFPIYLDGYLFLSKTSTGDIYNSDFDSPDVWSAGNFISTEISADYVIRIAKLKNYLIAFGNTDIEFFYNAAYSSGSPLGRNESYNQKVAYIGCGQQYSNEIFFVGKNLNGLTQVFSLSGEKVEVISTPAIDRVLQDDILVASEFKSKRSMGNIIAQDGHVFYVINSTYSVLVYDIVNGFWYVWTATVNTSNVIFQAAFNTKNNGMYVASGSNAFFGLVEQETYRDYGNNFNCIYQTEDIDLGTMNWKNCHRLSLSADMPLDTGSTSNVAVTWSDNDWLTSVTSRDLNLASLNPYITQLGRFRNRSFKFTYNGNYAMRFYGLEMDVNVGNI